MERGNSAIQTNKSKPKQRYKHFAPKIGPYSNVYFGRSSFRFGLARLDGRTKEAAYVRRIREELQKHVGPNPSVTQRLLIDRAAMLSLRLAQIDRIMLSGAEFSVTDTNSVIAFSNALTRCCRALGIHQEAAPAVSHLDSVLAELDDDAAA